MRHAIGLAAVLLLIPACDDESDGRGVVSAAGAGDGWSAPGGTVVVRSAGLLRFSPTAAVADPGRPAGARVLTDAQLAADVVAPESLVVDGQADGPRTIESTHGDVLIERLLGSAALVVRAPRGTVIVAGPIEGASVDVAAAALRVLPSGSLHAPLLRADAGTVESATGRVAAGAATFESAAGDVDLDGMLDLDGASGGRLKVVSRGTTQRVRVAARILARGGASADGTGGDGGGVEIDARSSAGRVLVPAGTEWHLDGGSGATGGGGGTVRIWTLDGDVVLGGTILARGGAGSARGGLGGFVHVWSDMNYDGVGGRITHEASGLIDVSGGPGAVGGSARNDGTVGVAFFPDDRPLFAIFLNSDTAPGPLRDGEILNAGRLVARGGAVGGAGGDVIFHGRRPGSREDPESGAMDLSGDGGAPPGDYSSQ